MARRWGCLAERKEGRAEACAGFSDMEKPGGGAQPGMLWGGTAMGWGRRRTWRQHLFLTSDCEKRRGRQAVCSIREAV